MNCGFAVAPESLHDAKLGFTGKYWAVYRFITKRGQDTDLLFRRIELKPGAELQVDSGTGAKIRMTDGSFKRTHVFRAVLSHSRKYSSDSINEACEKAWRSGALNYRTVKHLVEASLTWFEASCTTKRWTVTTASRIVA